MGFNKPSFKSNSFFGGWCGRFSDLLVFFCSWTPENILHKFIRTPEPRNPPRYSGVAISPNPKSYVRLGSTYFMEYVEN